MQATLSRELGAQLVSDSLARHIQAVLQGAFILAKATGNAGLVREHIDHLQRYIALLFKTVPIHETSP